MRNKELFFEKDITVLVTMNLNDCGFWINPIFPMYSGIFRPYS